MHWLGLVVVGLGFLAIILWVAHEARSGDDK